jgi:DNA repair exonuclease SbcCD ATPase subunit
MEVYKMADNNIFSVRLEEQDKEKLLELIQESGRSNKEFMGTLLNAYELNKAKVEIPDLAKDIEGLQALTQRINEYYINIGKRIEDTQKAKDIQFTKDIEIYKNRIDVLKADNEKINEDYEALQQVYNTNFIEVEELRKQLNQLEKTQESNNALISEYKSKIDTLTGIIEEYKGFKADNTTLKDALADLQSKNTELNNTIKNRDFNINTLSADLKAKENDMENLKVKHEEELKDIDIKHSKDLENFKKECGLNTKLAVAEVKEDLNNKLQDLQQKHNTEIEEYQAKYKSLLEELEKAKAPAKTKKTNTSLGSK